MKLTTLATVIACACSSSALAQKGVSPTTVIVGGHAMASDRNLVDNLSQSEDHTVLLSLLRTAGMADALQAHGPFTLFAPTDAAFAALPTGLVDSLRQPENRSGLVALLSMNILPGNFSSARLRYLLRAGKGTTELETVSNERVTLFNNGPSNIALHDMKGDVASITFYDAKQANGVLFVTDRVLQPG